MIKSAACLIACAAAFTSAGVFAQPAPVAPPPPAGAAPMPPAGAGPVPPAPFPPPPPPGRDFAGGAITTSGLVERYLINPFGEIDGLLLQGGMQIKMPPHMGTELAAAIRPQDQVNAQGWRENGGAIRASLVANARTGRQVAEHPPAPDSAAPLPRHLRAATLKPISARGEIRYALTGGRGEQNGVVLSDGTIVCFPPEAAYRFAPVLRVGSPLSVSGYGSETSAGRALEAVEMGTEQGAMRPVYDGGRPF